LPTSWKPLTWFAAGLCVAFGLAAPVFRVGSMFARSPPHSWIKLFPWWMAPLILVLGAGVTVGLWRVGLRPFALGVGAGTLLFGLVALAITIPT
jgi:hypothetical protein